MTINLTEAKLQGQLAAALEKIEPGLTLLRREQYIPNSLGTRGFIDILAKDSQDNFVLIEVKRTNSATREALHEVLKYLEGVKRHLALREDELRIIIAAVEWPELIIPFSSFVARTTCIVEGFQILLTGKGKISGIQPVDALKVTFDRVIAPWHLLSYYVDQASLVRGIADYQMSCRKSGIESYVLVELEPPASRTAGLPAQKQITIRQTLSEMAHLMGQEVSPTPTPVYKRVLYFAMQQLSRMEYEELLKHRRDENGIKSNNEDEEEDVIGHLHEELTNFDPQPHDDFVDISYAAKFQTLIQEEGWIVRRVRRFGSFARNTFLKDNTIIEELGGAQGNTPQRFIKEFDTANKAQIADVRRGVTTSLQTNPGWRKQILAILDEIERNEKNSYAKISIYNPSLGLLTFYMVASRENGVLYIPTYYIQLGRPANPRKMYYGCLTPTGARPDFEGAVDKFYDGSIEKLLWPLWWGGYESRDSEIMDYLGLSYESYRVDVHGDKRTFFRRDGHRWKKHKMVQFFEVFGQYLSDHEDFTDQLMYAYKKHWDGRTLRFDRNT